MLAKLRFHLRRQRAKSDIVRDYFLFPVAWLSYTVRMELLTDYRP